MFQNVHFLILSIMAIYTIIIGLMISRGHKQYQRWSSHDRSSTPRPNEKEEYERYQAAKFRFFQPSARGLIRVPVDSELFRFPLYLGELLFVRLNQLVSISFISLITLFLGFLLLTEVVPTDGPKNNHELYFIVSLVYVTAIVTFVPYLISRVMTDQLDQLCVKKKEGSKYESRPLIERKKFKYLFPAFVKKKNMAINNRQDSALLVGKLTRQYINLIVEVFFAANIVLLGFSVEVMCQAESSFNLAQPLGLSRVSVDCILMIPIMATLVSLFTTVPSRQIANRKDRKHYQNEINAKA
eukprot:GHVH01001969.1.p1 GENE.GHVH01001969.1~~GHVH01001969.1.p1  ORF type:complete len:298 (+),score=38.08 GHVH01001969.1:239-1132(+)